MIRLLRGEQTHVEAECEGVALSFDVQVISTSEQARLIDLATRPGTARAKHDYIKAILTSVVSNLVIGGKSVDAAELADKADLSHNQTYKVLSKVAEEVEHVVFAGADDEGKSEPQLAP